MRDGKSFKGRSEMHHAYVCTRTVKDGCWNKTAKLATGQVNPDVYTEGCWNKTAKLATGQVNPNVYTEGCWNKTAKLVTEQVNPNVCTEHFTKQEQNTHFFQMHMDQSPGYAIC